MTTPNKETPGLSPCPFCGSANVYATESAVCCDSCGGKVSNYFGKSDAIKAWNRRPVHQDAGELWQHKIADFVNGILHGDDEHKLWLRQAGEAFIKGEPLPPSRHKQCACAVCHQDVNKTGRLLRVSRKGDTKPVIWICPSHFNYEDWKFVEDNDERLERRHRFHEKSE